MTVSAICGKRSAKNSKDFGDKCADSFGQGQSAMVIQWGHYYNTLKTTWSDIDFGVFEIPTFDGNPYAYNRYNGESTIRKYLKTHRLRYLQSTLTTTSGRVRCLHVLRRI